jgi:hypothetical protein
VRGERLAATRQGLSARMVCPRRTANRHWRSESYYNRVCSSANPDCFATHVANHDARFCQTHRRIGSVRLTC